MFVALSRFVVRNGMEDEVHRAFEERPHLVDGVDGFVRLDVLRPIEHPEEFWLLTFWQDEPSYRTWHVGHGRAAAHQGMPKGLRLVPGAQQMTYFTHVTE